MLLPLFGIALARRVRKNVRFETLRVTSVGKNMRETSHANARSQFERWAEIPSSGPRGACETLKADLSC
jgi:hypothetical protein